MLPTRSDYTIKEFPSFHPKSEEYRTFYREEKRRCIEGYWCSGTWIPPEVYFMANYATILLQKRKGDKFKVPGRAEVWDIHFDTFWNWRMCRGLIGFDGQPEVQALMHYWANEKDHSPEREAIIRSKIPDIRQLLHTPGKDLGKPIYLNEAKNLLLLSARDSSKSVMAATIVSHEFLFDGAKEYNQHTIDNPATVDIFVGSEETKYTTLLLTKAKLIIDKQPGAIKMNDKYYPAPFSKKLTGSYAPGKDVIHSYKKKVGGTWLDMGTKSRILHRTFKDNPLAAWGSRNSVMIFEEIGNFTNLKATLEASTDTMKDAGFKYGSAFLLGTGGDMDSGTVDASEIFYDPDTYDMLSFDDEWESKGRICYFIPADLADRSFKDSNGISDRKAARLNEEFEREKLRKGKNSGTALDARIQYHPLIPSEMFLSRSGNIFPKKEIQQQLALLEGNQKYQDAEWIGILQYDENGRVEPKLDKAARPIRKFPINMTKDDYEGALVIWEHPEEDEYKSVPSGLYVAGCDPYDHDESGTPSLGSIIIYKKFLSLGKWSHLPVAEYTGRPKADQYYANCVKLLQYYNARCLYENEKKGMHQFFALKNYDYLLMEQPDYIKEVVPNSTVMRNKGIHMVEALKVHGEVLIKNWLEEEYAPGKMNLTKIRSIPLLKELMAYNRKQGNFDRVMAFMCLMYAVKEQERVGLVAAEKRVRVQDQDFFQRPIGSRSQPRIFTPEQYNSPENRGIYGF